jgi:phosphoribosylformylglycinamidine synthase
VLSDTCSSSGSTQLAQRGSRVQSNILHKIIFQKCCYKKVRAAKIPAFCKFVCKNVHLIPQSKIALPTAKLDHSEPLQIPIAHGEGNYYAPQSVLDELNANDQVLFRYCDINGDVTEEANPNGSIQNIAGVMNKKGNVFGMMPHPERAADLDLTNIDGRAVFESILGLVAH